MTHEWAEYDRILALRNARRAEVRAAVGYTDAPAQPRVRTRSHHAPATPSSGHDRWEAL